MKWFSGGVSAAITSCRQESALFIVFVHDDSLGSKSTDDAWSSKEVSALISSKKYVALKVLKNTLEYRQFSQLYAVFIVPSIFCIGRTGQNLVTMNGAQSAVQLREKLYEGFCKFDAETQPSLSSEIETSAPSTQPVVATQSIDRSTSSGNDGASTTSSKTDDSKEEALKRYQEKIRQQRQKRAKDEIEKDQHREIQRREHSKNVAKFKQEREEKQTQNWLKKRQEQKEEARATRERVKAKLEQDKLERQSQQKSSAFGYQQPKVDASHQVCTSTASTSVCRIQLKLPTGNSKVLEMNKTDTLGTLRESVAKEINRTVKSVLLCSSYPRKELSHDMDSHTMLQLQLVPSGVVIVRVKKDTYTLSPDSTTSTGVVGFLMSVVHFLLYCLNIINNTVMWMIGRGSEGNTSNESQQSQEQADESTTNLKGGSTDSLRVRKFRQEDYHDDSDEDGTYNGNSTQQQ